MTNPIQSKGKELILGVVNFHHRKYVAVLCADEITQEMEKAQTTYFQAVQKMLNEVKGDFPLLKQISTDGFQSENETFSHERLKTTEEWNKFCHLLKGPKLESPMNPQVSFIELSKEELFDTIKKKFHDKNNQTMDLTPVERDFIKTLGLNQLSQGIKNQKEFAQFCALLEAND